MAEAVPWREPSGGGLAVAADGGIYCHAPCYCIQKEEAGNLPFFPGCPWLKPCYRRICSESRDIRKYIPSPDGGSQIAGHRRQGLFYTDTKPPSSFDSSDCARFHATTDESWCNGSGGADEGAPLQHEIRSWVGCLHQALAATIAATFAFQCCELLLDLQ